MPANTKGEFNFKLLLVITMCKVIKILIFLIPNISNDGKNAGKRSVMSFMQQERREIVVEVKHVVSFDKLSFRIFQFEDKSISIFASRG